jgi:outer membrane immunogenic protein
MKRMLIAGALALAASGQALAADLPPAAPPPPPPRAPAAYIPVASPVYNWGGVYIGINGGYGFGQSNWQPAGGTATGNFDIDGGIVGGTLGFNYQMGQFVFGVETDIDWADINGTTSNATTCGTGVTCGFQTSDDYLGTIRGRVGYAFDRVLVYGTAGGAYGDIKATLTNAAIPFSGTTTSTEFGWTAGAGIEYAITDNITARVEYLFVDLANGSFSCAACGTGGGPASAPVSFDASLVRGGINFKFNPF